MSIKGLFLLYSPILAAMLLCGPGNAQDKKKEKTGMKWR